MTYFELILLAKKSTPICNQFKSRITKKTRNNQVLLSRKLGFTYYSLYVHYLHFRIQVTDIDRFISIVISMQASYQAYLHFLSLIIFQHSWFFHQQNQKLRLPKSNFVYLIELAENNSPGLFVLQLGKKFLPVLLWKQTSIYFTAS